MITRTIAVAVFAASAAIPSLAQPPSPHPRPMTDEAAQTRALNEAQLRGMPSGSPAEPRDLTASQRLKTTNTDYMSSYLRNRSSTAARAGARSQNDGLGVQKSIQKH